MLVICANWAITDGTLAGSAGIDARAWLHEVHRAVLRGGFGRDGRYRPVDGVEIVFAGDTFDWLVTTAWTAAHRPWHADAQSRQMRARVEALSLRRSRDLLAGLARWTRRGLRVPSADHVGRPRLATPVHVPVRVVFLAGDRDPWLEEAGLEADRFGWGVGRSWSDDVVDVRHGAELDPLGDSQERRGAAEWRPTIRESLLVDLVARFGARLLEAGHRRSLVGRLTAALAAANPLEMPALVNRASTPATESHSPDAPMRRVPLVDDWRFAVEDWHRAAVSVQPRCGLPCCPLDALADVLGAPSAWTQRAAATGLADLLESPLCPGGEPAVAGRRHVVLGHPTAADERLEQPTGAIVCLGRSAVRRSSAGMRRAECTIPAAPAGVATIVGLRQPPAGVVWQSLDDPSPDIGRAPAESIAFVDAA